MYARGTLILVDTCEQQGSDACHHTKVRHRHIDGKTVIADSRADGLGEKVIVPAVVLPHSCDEWVIGGAKEVRALIEDLQLLLAKLEG